VLIDGTFWTDDELLKTGRSQKTAHQIAICRFRPRGLMSSILSTPRSQGPDPHQQYEPILNEDSAEHRAVREAGWEIAYDGWSSTCDFISPNVA